MDIANLKEYISTGRGTEGSLLIPRRIYNTIVEETAKALIPRTEAGWVFGPADIPGSSIDVNLATANSLKVRLVAEGAEIPLDSSAYTSTNIKPKKFGVAVRITREMQEDSQFNLLEHDIKIASKRLAENENNLVLTALDNAANTVTGGASITIANITRAMQYLDDSDFAPTTLALGNEVLNDLRNIDTFVEADKKGDTEMMKKGFVGVIYGMNCIKFSTNAAPSTTYSKYAYVFDRDYAYAIAEKRPIAIENFDLATYDMSGSVITQRIAVKEIRTSAIAKITTS